MSEPIDVIPGVYTKPDGSKVTGLCVMLDNQDAHWEVTTSDNYTIMIKIKEGATWSAQNYTDPKTGRRMVQIFCEGGKLMGLTQDFTQQAEGGYTSNTGAANGGEPGLKIYYSTPEDGKTA